MAFQRHPFAEQRRRSAVVLAKVLLREVPGLLPEHRRECLGIALWKYTEAEGVHKHKTRFRSKASLSASPADLRHDHVFQRANMIEALMRVGETGVEEIIKNAVGCTITKAAHIRLNEFKHLDGWERYNRAGIEIIDMEAETPLEF
jgi:hypothetical protein